jgi:hypothetical protein
MVFYRSLLVLFRLAFVLSLFLRFTDSSFPFCIFKLFLLFYKKEILQEIKQKLKCEVQFETRNTNHDALSMWHYKEKTKEQHEPH